MATGTSARRPSALHRWTRGLVIGALAGLALGLVSAPASAADDELSKDTLACLKCHDKPGLLKKTEDGQTLSLSISGKDFIASMHKKQDCTDCHSQLDDKTHGKPGHETALKNRRELTQSMQEGCRDCHKKTQKVYDDSLHAALVKDGSDKAPLCADCHNAHTQASAKLAVAIDKMPCGSCHDKILAAYKQDVHGLERVKKGKEAPGCADCHKSHDVQSATLGGGLKDTCLNCHKEALAQHKDWLPNADRHFEAIACAACHAPAGQRRVNLRLYDAQANQQLREKSGVPKFVQRVQAGGNGGLGLDERALFSLLDQFNADSATDGRIIVRGRLELRDGLQAHQLAEKDKALKECDTCHSAQSEAFQSVVLTIAGADGRPLRTAVQKDVLTSLTALDSMRGFYVLGSTRIKLLDWLLVLAVVATIGGCLAHAVMRRMTRGLRARLEAEARAEAAAAAAAERKA
jgi:Doubled CXXCH motif (Paired_CXXCH_1)